MTIETEGELDVGGSEPSPFTARDEMTRGALAQTRSAAFGFSVVDLLARHPGHSTREVLAQTCSAAFGVSVDDLLLTQRSGHSTGMLRVGVKVIGVARAETGFAGSGFGSGSGRGSVRAVVLLRGPYRPRLSANSACLARGFIRVLQGFL